MSRHLMMRQLMHLLVMSSQLTSQSQLPSSHRKSRLQSSQYLLPQLNCEHQIARLGSVQSTEVAAYAATQIRNTHSRLLYMVLGAVSGLGGYMLHYLCSSDS